MAGTLSGGEQQMLAMGRALMSKPRLLMLDEPSMGLAPILVEQIFDIIQELNQHGTTILLVEQNAQMALSVAHRGYVLETGKIVTTGSGEELLEDEAVKKPIWAADRPLFAFRPRQTRTEFLCRTLSHKITHQNATSCP